MAAANTYNVFAIWTAMVLCVQSEPLCLRGDFDSQLQLILQQEMLSPQEAADILALVLADVQHTLDRKWQGYELSVCGSLATRLAIKSSDVDLVVRLPNFNSSASDYVLQETETLFKEQPELYSQIEYRSNNKLHFSFFSFFHIPSERKVEIEFESGDLSVENSKLIRYYFQLDKRYLALGGFLKYWFNIHGVTGHGKDFLANYGLYLLIIFYLQQKHMVFPGNVIQMNAKRHVTSDGWDVGFDELPFRSRNTENLHQLLGGFFKYYSNFDFEQYIVSPYAAVPIPRNAFNDVDNFPEVYYLRNPITKQLEIRDYWSSVSVDICIQDVFVHSSNVVELSHEVALKFKDLLEPVATLFDELPSENVLRAMISYNIDDVDEIIDLECI